MSLLALQRDFCSWLGQESAEAAARLGPEAAPGLAVYLNNYRSQLMNCLAETFPNLHAWMGDAAFHGACATHIERVPPSSWTLDDYPKGFPASLAVLYPDDPELGELAALESALSQAFVGPDAPSVGPEQLGEVDWDQAVLSLVPTFQLLASRTNAAALWSALDEQRTPPPVENMPEGSQLAIWRAGFTPRFRTLEAAETQALVQIAQGMSFGELCTHLVTAYGEDEAPVMAGSWLGTWLQEGMIAQVR